MSKNSLYKRIFKHRHDFCTRSGMGEIINQRDNETLPNTSFAGIFMTLKAHSLESPKKGAAVQSPQLHWFGREY